MAGAVQRDLYLQVDASLDPFTRALKAGKPALADFSSDVDAALQSIEDRFKELGGTNADAAAKAMETSFRRSFAAMQDAAQAALQMPTTDAGALNLNVAAMQQAATNAANLAITKREIADAAAAAAAAESGENVALNTLAASTAAAAIASEEYALAMGAQASTVAKVQTQLNLAGATSASVTDVITASHNRMSASGMILEHVIRSTVDSYSAGLPIATIFGEQVARIGEAAALSGDSLGKVGAFLTSGWGVALSAAIAVGAPFAVKLLEADDEAKKLAEDLDKAATSSDSFGKAESDLGKIIDLTTGAMKTRNEVLVQTIRLQAQANLLAAQAAEKTDAKALGKVGQPGFLQSFLDLAPGGGSQYGDLSGGERVQQNQAATAKQFAPLQALISHFQTQLSAVSVNSSNQSFDDQMKPVIDGALAAVDQLAKNKQLGNQDPIKVKEAFLALAKDRTDQFAQNEAIDVVDGKPVPQDLKPYKKTPKPKADRTAQNAANDDKAYQDQMRQAEDAYAKAMLGLADGAEQRYAIEVAEIQSDLDRKNAAIQDAANAKIASQKLTGAAAQKVLADAATVQAKNQETATVLLQVALRKEQLAQQQLAYEADKDARDARDALLTIDANFVTTRKARLELEKKLLADRQAQQLADLQRQQASTTDLGEKARLQTQINRLPDQNAAQNKNLEHTYQDPLQSYSEQLHKNTDDMNDALKGVEADGLKGLEDGLVGILNGTKSVADAFKDMASSIISDLARIAIEKAIVSAIPGLGLKDGGSVTAIARATGGIIPAFADGGANGMFSGIGGPRDDSNLVWLSNGEFVTNAASTKRYLPLLKAINDNNLPGYADGGFIGSSLSNLSVRSLSPSGARQLAANDNRSAPISFDLRGAVMTADLLQQMQTMAAQSGGQALTAATGHTNDMFRMLARRKL